MTARTLRSSCFVSLVLLSITSLSHGFQAYLMIGRKSRANSRSDLTPRGRRERPSLTVSRVSRTADDAAIREATRDELLQLISGTPRNAPTSKATTAEILSLVKELESMCPTADDFVLQSLSGGWELLWTAQDQSSAEWSKGPLRTWINPLENQSYSNNPNSSEMGRFNPVLPRAVQDRLEDLGVIQDTQAARSSQSVDLQKQRVRNVVSVGLPALDRRASLTVDVGFKPNRNDKRRVDVKFDSCRLLVPKSPLDVTFPLGIFGPTGWLRTGYIDEAIRITRGHKGSVFVLSRTSQKKA